MPPFRTATVYISSSWHGQSLCKSRYSVVTATPLDACRRRLISRCFSVCSCDNLQECRLPKPDKRMLVCNEDKPNMVSALYRCENKFPGKLECDTTSNIETILRPDADLMTLLVIPQISGSSSPATGQEVRLKCSKNACFTFTIIIIST